MNQSKIPQSPPKLTPSSRVLAVSSSRSVPIGIENDEFLRGQLKVRYGSVMTNATRTVVSVARSVVLGRVCTAIALYNYTINANYVI